MDKIFVLSLHRSATQSVNDLLLRSGLSTCHWPGLVNGVDYQSQVVGKEEDTQFIANVLRPLLDSVTAVGDTPIPILYDVLDAWYPNARFIALRRDPKGWAKSVRKHIGTRTLEPFEKAVYYRYLKTRPDYISQVSDSELISVYDAHFQTLERYFSNRPNFAIFDLADRKIGENF